MALADVYELRLSGTFDGRNNISVFHAQRTSGAHDADVVGQAFIDTVLSSIAAAQHTAFAYVNLEVKSLGDPLDFALFNVSAFTGSVVGDPLPGFNACAIQFFRTRTDMNHGFKRFSGLTEPDVSASTVQPAQITRMNTIGTNLVSAWDQTSPPLSDVANYVIVKRICDETDPVTGKCLQYRLPISDVELVLYIPTTFASLTKVRSQVSRKVL